MIAKYNGYCKVTNQQIVAGVTEIEKVNGVWQAVCKSEGKYAGRLAGITTAQVLVTVDHPTRGMIEMLLPRKVMETKDSAWQCVVKVENDSRPRWSELPEQKESELDRQWRIDGGR